MWTITVGTLGLAAGGFAWRAPWRSTPAVEPGGSELVLVPQRERRATLEPASFTGKARRAYEVAREVPGLLDRLRCYCPCAGVGHTSLLSCYTDLHAAT